MGLDDLHPEAYGLNRYQHEKVVYGARNHYTEAWIAARFNITLAAVRDICLKDGVIPPRNEKQPDGTYICHPCVEIRARITLEATNG